MSDGGKMTGRARGEDPTATGFNPLYAGRGTSIEGRHNKVAASDETCIYAEVFPIRSDGNGPERRCSSAELCGYFICPLTALFLALGAFVLAVLLLTGILTPLSRSKELAELHSAVQALQQSLDSMASPVLQVVPVSLRTADFGNCTEQRFSCTLNATSNVCGVELGPVQPSYIPLKEEALRLTADHCWYQLLQGPVTNRVSLQLFFREISLGSYSSADMFCLATSSFEAGERGVVHLYHRDCPLKDYILLTT